MEFGPIPAPARDAFLVDALAAGGVEGLDLGGGILVFGLGHAGVAEQAREMLHFSVAFASLFGNSFVRRIALLFSAGVLWAPYKRSFARALQAAMPASSCGHRQIEVDAPTEVRVEAAIGVDVGMDGGCQAAMVLRCHPRHPCRLSQHPLQHQRVHVDQAVL